MNEFLWSVRVYYEDTDAGGVVYYANYLKYMERARTEWLRQLGFEQDSLLEKERIAFTVRKVELEYLHPARFNEALQVTARITRVGGASLSFHQEVRREQGNQLLCVGAIRIACVNLDKMQPVRIPKQLLEEFKHVE